MILVMKKYPRITKTKVPVQDFCWFVSNAAFRCQVWLRRTWLTEQQGLKQIWSKKKKTTSSETKVRRIIIIRQHHLFENVNMLVRHEIPASALVSFKTLIPDTSQAFMCVIRAWSSSSSNLMFKLCLVKRFINHCWILQKERRLSG